MVGSTVEAEKYDANSPIGTFRIQPIPSGGEYIATDTADATNAPTDTGANQAWYSFKATATQISLYATVDFVDAHTDSFLMIIPGLLPLREQTVLQTKGYQEIMLVTVANAVVGQNYVLKIQRREIGSKIDKFRMVGGNFTAGSVNQNPSPAKVDLVNGKSKFDFFCVSCHGNKGQGGSAPAIRAIPNATFPDKPALAAYINLNMPKTNPALCQGQCGADVASYIASGFVDPNPAMAGCAGRTGLLLCDDFEGAAPGTAGSPWSLQGGYMKEVTTAKAHSGTKAFHVVRGNAGSGFIQEGKTYAGIPAGGNYWVRAYIMLDVTDLGHEAFVEVDTSNDQIRILANNGLGDGNNGPNGRGKVMVDPRSNDRNYRISKTHDLPRQSWNCYEWNYTPTELHTFLDGQEILDIVAPYGRGGINGLKFGFERFVGRNEPDPGQVWYDDIAVSANRIGCN